MTLCKEPIGVQNFNISIHISAFHYLQADERESKARDFVRAEVSVYCIIVQNMLSCTSANKASLLLCCVELCIFVQDAYDYRFYFTKELNLPQ